MAFGECVAGMLACLLMAAPAAAIEINGRLLDAIRFAESSNGKMLYGDDGCSLGPYQFGAAAWVEVSSWRARQGRPVYPYDKRVFQESIARSYALDWLRMLRRDFVNATGREPQVMDLYLCYNLGFGKYRALGFDRRRVNRLTVSRAALVARLAQP
ncbi:MAG: hypothetical protein HZA91_13640 [Verrucomicrobia bacterium]|nr:hypothetical protein [Verrucomicrobiota bacterium]